MDLERVGATAERRHQMALAVTKGRAGIMWDYR